MKAKWIFAFALGLFAASCRREVPQAIVPKTIECNEVADCIAQARQAIEANYLDAALHHLDRALEKDPANQEARRLRGDLYYKKNDLDNAMADYAELRTERSDLFPTPTPPPIFDSQAAGEHMRQAHLDEESGKIEDAIDHYTAVLGSDVASTLASIACQNRGNLYFRKGDITRALADYQQAIRLNPRSAGAYANRGYALAQQGEHESAIRDYDEALRFDPNLYQAWFDRGLSYRALGLNEKAQRDFDQALALNPDYAAAHVDRAGMYAQRKKIAKAIEEYKAALKIDPTLAEALVGLAALCLGEGKHAEAAGYMQRAVAARPNSPVALNSLGWLRATSPNQSLRNGREAVELSLRACELSYWMEFQIVDTLAAAYAETGEFEKAAHFEEYAINLPSMKTEERADAEKRLRQYRKRQPYRDTRR